MVEPADSSHRGNAMNKTPNARIAVGLLALLSLGAQRMLRRQPGEHRGRAQGHGRVVHA